ncbi:MAG: hypothetical protein IJV82_02505 [Oscillospiraceae bacterium]|nr:hypothetical protein [Oscillospiraceae bacterium]
MDDWKESFSYTYSAAQQQEVEHIRSKYLPPQEDKMERLRRLHHGAGRKAKIWAIILGTVGALVLGTGMSLAMTELGALLGQLAMVVGIVVGLLGLVLVALAYPVYNHILRRERQRIAPEILRLTDELLK